MPQRSYEVETTRGAKGYRLVSSLDPNMSAVEVALKRGGFTYYMPAEFKVVRNRRKTGVYQLRRFALLQGYVFVYNVIDFEKLRKIPGVAGLLVSYVGDERVPMQVSLADIMIMRTIEARSQAEADKRVATLNSSERATMNKDAQKAIAAAKRKLNPGQNVKILWGRGIGHEATLLGWEDSQHVKAMIDNLKTGEVEEISVPYDAVRLVLEAAE